MEASEDSEQIRQHSHQKEEALKQPEDSNIQPELLVDGVRGQPKHLEEEGKGQPKHLEEEGKGQPKHLEEKGKGQPKHLEDEGTGGTPLSTFLKNVRAHVHSAML